MILRVKSGDGQTSTQNPYRIYFRPSRPNACCRTEIFRTTRNFLAIHGSLRTRESIPVLSNHP
eukprot:14882330-Ditylum_brightwellii.AAC.1